MNDQQLMQWALDALDGYARNCICEGGGGTCDAANALRARLQQWTIDDAAYRPGGLSQIDLAQVGKVGTWGDSFNTKPVQTKEMT